MALLLLRTAGLVVVSVLLTGCGKSVEDCILENIDKAQDRTAVVAIKIACKDKYGSPNPFADPNFGKTEK